MNFTRPLVAALAALVLPTAALADDNCPSFEVTGTGPDLVLVPGLGSSPQVWDGVKDSLAKDYRLHLVHVAGFAGRAAEGEPDMVIDRAAAEVISHLDCEGVVAALYAGHSLGGFLGLKLAAEHPDRIEQLVVVDALPFYPLIFSPAATVDAVRGQADGFRAQIIAQDEATFAASQRMGARALVQSADDQERVVGWSLASDRASFAGGIHTLMTTDLRASLSEIKAPTTVIVAANPYAPRTRMEPLYQSAYANLAKAKLTIVEDSYHFIMFDQPAAFEEALRGALEGSE